MDAASFPVLCLQWNNSTAPVPCAICDDWIEPHIGMALFQDGTGQLVCDDCRGTYVPELLVVREIVRPYTDDLLDMLQHGGEPSDPASG